MEPSTVVSVLIDSQVHELENTIVISTSPSRCRLCPATLIHAFVIIVLMSQSGMVQAQIPGSSNDEIEPLDLMTCVRQALAANPNLQSRLTALGATRADLVVARSIYYPIAMIWDSPFSRPSIGEVDQRPEWKSLQRLWPLTKQP